MPRTENEVERYQAERTRLHELKREADDLERRRDALVQRLAEPRDDVGAAAEALLDGTDIKAPREASDELVETRAKLRVVRRAVDMQKDRVAEAKAARDAALCDAAEPRIKGLAQDLSDLAVAFGEKADELHGALAELDSEDVARLHRFPGLRLFPLRAGVPESRLNTFVDELVDGYGAKVKRPTRDAAVEARKRSHLADEERKKKAGIGLAAGPDGIHDRARGRRVAVR